MSSNWRVFPPGFYFLCEVGNYVCRKKVVDISSMRVMTWITKSSVFLSWSVCLRIYQSCWSLQRTSFGLYLFIFPTGFSILYFIYFCFNLCTICSAWLRFSLPPFPQCPKVDGYLLIWNFFFHNVDIYSY